MGTPSVIGPDTTTAAPELTVPVVCVLVVVSVVKIAKCLYSCSCFLVGGIFYCQDVIVIFRVFLPTLKMQVICCPIYCGEIGALSVIVAEVPDVTDELTTVPVGAPAHKKKKCCERGRSLWLMLAKKSCLTTAPTLKC